MTKTPAQLDQDITASLGTPLGDCQPLYGLRKQHVHITRKASSSHGCRRSSCMGILQ